jgi:hypothetical protein
VQDLKQVDQAFKNINKKKENEVNIENPKPTIHSEISCQGIRGTLDLSINLISHSLTVFI